MQQVNSLRHGIAWNRGRTWHWQDTAGLHRTPTAYAERRTSSVAFLGWIDRLWSHRRIRAYRYAKSHPAIQHRALWLCIHSGEGAWNDPNSGHNGHYGGLQMTSPWGRGAYYVYRADWLTPFEQMRKAELGYRASDYSHTWLLGQWYHPECLAYA